jgi:hypothetical protein
MRGNTTDVADAANVQNVAAVRRVGGLEIGGDRRVRRRRRSRASGAASVWTSHAPVPPKAWRAVSSERTSRRMASSGSPRTRAARTWSHSRASQPHALPVSLMGRGHRLALTCFQIVEGASPYSARSSRSRKTCGRRVAVCSIISNRVDVPRQSCIDTRTRLRVHRGECRSNVRRRADQPPGARRRGARDTICTVCAR